MLQATGDCSLCSGEITGKALVPEHLCRTDFTAELWIKPVQEALGAKVGGNIWFNLVTVVSMAIA